MKRVKVAGCCMVVMLVFILGWKMKVSGEGLMFQAEFLDSYQQTYIPKNRTLKIEIDEKQGIKEDVFCQVNGEDAKIEWKTEQIGYVLFEEEGTYDVVVTMLEEEKEFDSFTIDKTKPTMPVVSLGGYQEGQWTKDDVEVKVKGSEAISPITRYEYREHKGQWKEILNGSILFKDTYQGEIEIRSVAASGLYSDVSKRNLMIWKKNLNPVTLSFSEANKKGWYTREPEVTKVSSERKEGPRVTDYYEVTSLETGESKTITNRIPQRWKDGRYQISWWSEDELGHISKKKQKSDIYIDTIQPMVQLDGDVTGKEYRNQAQKVTIKVSDENLDKKETKIVTTGIQETKDGIVEVVFKEDGKQSCEVIAVDEAGNEAKEVIETFTLDQKKPELKIENVEALKSYRKNISPKIIWKDTNLDASKCVVRLNNEEQKVSLDSQGTMKLHMKKDAHYTLFASGVDQAGNETKQSISFTVNRRGSVIRLMTKGVNGKTVNQKRVKIGFEVENIDPYVVNHFTLNGQEVDFKQKRNQVIMDEELKKDGQYKVKFQVKDMSGNVNEYEHPIRFQFDGTPPEILILGVEDKKIYHERTMVQIKTQKKEDKLTKLTINDTAYDTKDNQQKFWLNQGIYRIVVRGKDEAGNETIKKVSFQIKTKDGEKESRNKVEIVKEPKKNEKKETNWYWLFILIPGIFIVRFLKTVI